MNVLIPIVSGGKGNENNQYIRSLFEIQKKTILEYVYDSLAHLKDAHFTVVINKEDARKYHLDNMVHLLIPDCKIIISDGETKGAACSCLLAVDDIVDEESLIIVGGDQLLLENPQNIVDSFQKEDYDGGVVIFEDIHPRWSYVKLNEEGLVIEAAEKRPISRNATTGFYYFKRGEDFVRSAEDMIRKGASVDGKYYVCPAFNEMVLRHKRIGTYRISKMDYFNFGQQKSVDDYERYLKGEQ